MTKVRPASALRVQNKSCALLLTASRVYLPPSSLIVTVTVIFSDIIHFTDISRVMTPLKVSQMLDRLYLAFDKAARTNDVFKVEVRNVSADSCALTLKQCCTHTMLVFSFQFADYW